MMGLEIVTLDEIKRHARLDGDWEDGELELYGVSAEQVTLRVLDRTVDELVEKYGEVPVPVKHAVLMLTAHSYAQREPASVQQMYTVPYTYDLLVKPYMKL